MRLTRRSLLTGIAGLALPAIARAQARPSVVVVGGGAGGASAAKHLAQQTAGKLDITLVTSGETFTTCFFSNHVIAGLRPMTSITHSYERLASRYGIRLVTTPATAIDRDNRQVRVGETALRYDRLVLSPGIDMIFESIEGYSEAAAEIAPHAWQAGRQTEILKSKLDALRDGDPVVLVSPPNPYRCPPGPYERASVIAHVLKSKGFTRSRITILDHKDKYSKQSLFEAGWANHFPGMIEWYGPSVIGAITSVDAAAGKVFTDFDTFQGALLNIIPAQRAGAIALQSDLADTTGYCPIDPENFRSMVDPSIHVIGDAAIAGEMPKSAFSANRQARYAAAAIIADLLGVPRTTTELANTCWSMLEVNDSVKIGASYAIVDGHLTAVDPFLSANDEPAVRRHKTFEESLAWYDSAIADMFG